MTGKTVAQQGRPIAFVGGTLIDGVGQDPLHKATVIVDGPALSKVGRVEDIEISDECEVIDVSGKTIMPGLIDCHCHISYTTLDLESRLYTPRVVQVFLTAEILRRTLHAGFTTIRDAGGVDVGFRQAVEMGLVEGPRLLVSGRLSQTGGHPDTRYPCGVEFSLSDREICDGVPEVQRAARNVLRKGVDFVKICTTGGVGSPLGEPEDTEWTPEELRAIVYEASARKKAVMAHAEGNQGIKNAILAGVWSIEHGSMLDDEAIEMLLEAGIYLVPTLSVVYEEMERMEEMGLSPASMVKARRVDEASLKSFDMAVEAGVKIAVGSDALYDEMQGKNARELELMVRHGLAPMEVLVAATGVAAETCRIDHKVGTLVPGKLADLLVVDGDPLDDVSILQDESRLLLVMKEGIPYVDRLRPPGGASLAAIRSGIDP